MILVSSRHTDQIVALEMTGALGAQHGVRWIIGSEGTMPYEGEAFRHTHGVKTKRRTATSCCSTTATSATAPPSSGAPSPTEPRPAHRGRRLVGGPADWSATQVWEHRMIDPSPTSHLRPIIGDTDELANGNILVTYGGSTVDHSDFFRTHVDIVEIVPAENGEGDVVWELRTGGDTQETAESTYRADRWESLYFGPSGPRADQRDFPYRRSAKAGALVDSAPWRPLRCSRSRACMRPPPTAASRS
ncbi:MAG: hypothetical protein R2695_21010 [Acidimicrobiales bacterium]